MNEQKHDDACGASRSDAVLDVPTCAIGGVFRIGRHLAACSEHGCGNACFRESDCEHKQAPNY